jgi:hypothetical protein
MTINPFSDDVIKLFTKKLSNYTVNKTTFTVPLDWKVDGVLLRSIAKARLAEIPLKQNQTNSRLLVIASAYGR